MGHESIETTKKYEHFAHEIIAAENNISHLDMCLGNGQKKGSGRTKRHEKRCSVPVRLTPLKPA